MASPSARRLVKHPRVNMVSLTGDVATGKEVAKAAAATLKKVHLELGGKAPVLIFDDADMDLVIPGIKMAGFANSGQDCTAATRLYASGRIYDKLLSALVPAVESIVVGDIQEEDTNMGPVISAEHRKRVSGFLDRAHVEGPRQGPDRRKGAQGKGVLVRADGRGRRAGRPTRSSRRKSSVR